MTTCPACGIHFYNKMQFGAHKRVCRTASPSPPTTLDSDDDTDDDAVAPVITRPITPLMCLARRPKQPWGRRVQYNPPGLRPGFVNRDYARDYRELQASWNQYVQDACSSCCPEFWRVYKCVVDQTVACQDSILSCVRELAKPTGKWPRSNRTLRASILRLAGDFWPNVTLGHLIDLSHFGLPGCNSINFSFVDPVYAWVHACNELHAAGIPLHWDPQKLMHPHMEQEVHGAGIQYSELLRCATLSIPVGGKIALINISWDGGGTGVGSRSCVPIIVQVMNTNSMSTKAVFVIGYLPYIEVAHGYKTSSNCVKARRFLLQVFRICVQIHIYEHLIYVILCVRICAQIHIYEHLVCM
jgi:hypothetical protein